MIFSFIPAIIAGFLCSKLNRLRGDKDGNKDIAIVLMGLTTLLPVLYAYDQSYDLLDNIIFAPILAIIWVGFCFLLFKPSWGELFQNDNPITQRDVSPFVLKPTNAICRYELDDKLDRDWETKPDPDNS